MGYNITVTAAVSDDLAESLAVAAASADLYHHALCQILDTELDEDGRESDPVCTCGLPGLLRGLSAALGVGGARLSVEAVWMDAEARLEARCAA